MPLGHFTKAKQEMLNVQCSMLNERGCRECSMFNAQCSMKEGVMVPACWNHGTRLSRQDRYPPEH
jgi:hypothetical protein